MAEKELTAETKGAQLGTEWAPFTSFRKEMDNLFDRFLGGTPMNFAGSPVLSQYLRPDTAEFGANLVPSMDANETDTEIILTAELPGIDEKDVTIEVEDGVLVLSGEKRSEVTKQAAEGRGAISERRYGRFERRIAIPESVRLDNCSAIFEKGVLTIVLPKDAAKVSKRRTIAVQAKH